MSAVEALVGPAVEAAAAAAPAYGRWEPARRRDLLHALADALEAAREELVGLALAETHLTRSRLDGEVTRTTGQLRLLGDHVASGGHLPRRRSASGAPDGSDVVVGVVPVGVVAVFAASNFPFAFGVPGGDTAAALAAGCPVVVKAHPAQPRLGARLVELLTAAAHDAGAPDGTLAAVASDDPALAAPLSIALVRAPAVRAVGFTGSLAGGRALMDAAAARPDPIPVYAEMGSLNPVVVLPGAATAEWGRAVAGAVTGSGGQLCTKPGLVLVPTGDAGQPLVTALVDAVTTTAALPLLTGGMLAAHDAWLATAAAQPGWTVRTGPAAEGITEGATEAAVTCVVEVAADALTGPRGADLLVEHFGPAVVVVRTDDVPSVLSRLEGSLTATLLGDEDSAAQAAPLVCALASVAGRVVWNGVPTGVGVCEAMQHGGPWPSTGAPWSTSVGTAAVDRFVRPVALQNLPAALLAAVEGAAAD